MSSCLRILVFLLLLSYSVASCDPSSTLLISAKTIEQNEIAADVPLIGFRRVSETFFQLSDRQNDSVGIPVAFFINSTSSIPTVRQCLLTSGKNVEEANFFDWVKASDASLRLSTFWELPPRPMNIYEEKNTNVRADAHLIALLPLTEMFSQGEQFILYSKKEHGSVTTYAKAIKEVYSLFEDSYRTLRGTAVARPRDAEATLQTVSATFHKYPQLKKAAEFLAGNVTFGKPLFRPGHEAGLQVPKYLQSQKDVYLFGSSAEFVVGQGWFRELSQSVVERDFDIIRGA